MKIIMTNYRINNYLQLEKKVEQIAQLRAIESLGHWDSAVNLQSGSVQDRQKELATLGSVAHEMSISDELSGLINKAFDEIDFLDEWQKSNLLLIRKSNHLTKSVSTEMAHEYSMASSSCEFIWRQCRAKNDFASLIPYLDRVFAITKKIAEAKTTILAKNPYEVLVDSYDPEREVAEINDVYEVLKAELPKIIDKIVQKQASDKVINLTDKIDEHTQHAIGLKIMKKMSFDIDRGRLDKSTHPFCSGGRNDVRITTRYDESNFLSSLLGVIHETGHALYQQALPGQYNWQPVGAPKGMTFHESQSLIMEMQAAASPNFSEYLAKLLKDDFKISGQEYSGENLYKLMTRVSPSFIRVDADEVTYSLHVIMRFEIEQEIISGNITAIDLPAIWNSKMEKYLGIIPKSYSEGCLQDIHWPSGMLGYFPSYANGAIVASMLMQRIKKHNSIDSDLLHGDFSHLNNHLNKNLRSLGSVMDSKKLLKQATGSDCIEPMVFINYLQNKYL